MISHVPRGCRRRAATCVVFLAFGIGGGACGGEDASVSGADVTVEPPGANAPPVSEYQARADVRYASPSTADILQAGICDAIDEVAASEDFGRPLPRAGDESQCTSLDEARRRGVYAGCCGGGVNGMLEHLEWASDQTGGVLHDDETLLGVPVYIAEYSGGIGAPPQVDGGQAVGVVFFDEMTYVRFEVYAAGLTQDEVGAVLRRVMEHVLTSA